MRWLGLDLGDKRTGVAISNPEATFAVPLLVLEHDACGPSPAQIDAVLSEHDVQGIVVGLPLSLSGSPSTQTRHAVDVAMTIARHIGATMELSAHLQTDFPEVTVDGRAARSGDGPAPLRMVLWDETLSTWGAHQAVPPRKKRTQGRKAAASHLDAHAAAIILQSYLESLHGNDELPSMVPEDCTD